MIRLFLIFLPILILFEFDKVEDKPKEEEWTNGKL